MGVASGVALGAHFGFWISSLDHTSVVLASTQPVFVAILAYLLFGERTSPLSFGGILAKPVVSTPASQAYQHAPALKGLACQHFSFFPFEPFPTRFAQPLGWRAGPRPGLLKC